MNVIVCKSPVKAELDADLQVKKDELLEKTRSNLREDRHELKAQIRRSSGSEKKKLQADLAAIMARREAFEDALLENDIKEAKESGSTESAESIRADNARYRQMIADREANGDKHNDKIFKEEEKYRKDNEKARENARYELSDRTEPDFVKQAERELKDKVISSHHEKWKAAKKAKNISEMRTIRNDIISEAMRIFYAKEDAYKAIRNETISRYPHPLTKRKQEQEVKKSVKFFKEHLLFILDDYVI